MCFFSVFKRLLKLSLQFIFHWHLLFEEQCRDSSHLNQNGNISQCAPLGNMLLSLYLLGSPGTPNSEHFLSIVFILGH